MLGTELKQIRIVRGISVEEVAQRTGISVSALKSIESGKRYPSLRTLETVCECLDITVVVGPAETIIEY